MELKPQDLVVSLKVLTLGKKKWSQRELAQSLGMSLSEVNGAIKRAIGAGLMLGKDSRNEAPRSVPYALREFINHGVRYSFPIEKGAKARGIPTGMIGAQLQDEFSNSEESDMPVWPSPNGKVRGIGVKPLYKSIPEIAEREENKDLYAFLSLVDMIRDGRVRERNLASQVVSKKLDMASHFV
ncbi:MAG: hypothetical protein ABI036_09415 [Fibrobacteria bacterium]